MHCIAGTVSEVKHGWTWAGEGGSFWATTTFSIGESQVSLDTSTRPAIENQDRVAVAGQVRRDRFTALAYKNLSSGASGNSGFAVCFIPGLLFVLVALVLLSYSLIAAGLFAVLGALSSGRAVRIGAAVRALDSAA